MHFNAVEFGTYLRNKRKEVGLTLVELSKKSGVSQPYLSQLENGKGGAASPEILKKIAIALEVPFIELGVKAGLFPLDEWLLFALQRLSKDGCIMKEHKNFIKGLLTNYGITEVDDNSSITEILNAIKRRENASLGIALYLKIHDYDTITNGLIPTSEVPLGAPHKVIAGHHLDENSLESVLQNRDLTFNGHKLTKQDRKRILDMLELLFPEKK